MRSEQRRMAFEESRMRDEEDAQMREQRKQLRLERMERQRAAREAKEKAMIQKMQEAEERQLAEREEKRKKWEEEARKKAEKEARLRKNAQAKDEKKGKKKFKLRKDLWFKLAAKAKEIAKEERKKKNAGGMIEMMRKKVEKRREEELALAAKAAEDARFAAEAAASARSERERELALAAQAKAEQEQARALASVAELEQQLNEATGRLQEDTGKEDEFEDSLFDMKQEQAVLRAEIAKSEKKREKRRAAAERHRRFVARASCEYVVTEDGAFRKRTLSENDAVKLKAKLQQALQDRRDGFQGERDWDLDFDDDDFWEDGNELDVEMKRVQKEREKQKNKSEKGRNERVKDLENMAEFLEERKSDAMGTGDRILAARNTMGFSAEPLETGDQAAAKAMEAAKAERQKKREAMMAKQNAAVQRAKEDNKLKRKQDARSAERMAQKEQARQDIENARKELQASVQQTRSNAQSTKKEIDEMLLEADKFQNESDRVLKARRENEQVDIQAMCTFADDDASSYAESMSVWSESVWDDTVPMEQQLAEESYEQAMEMLVIADTFKEMSHIKHLSHAQSHLLWVNVKRAKKKLRKEKRKLMKQNGYTEPARFPITPSQLSPRRRCPNDPPSPTKTNLQALKAQRGDPPPKVERSLSSSALDRINSQFSASDKLREEAMSNITNFDTTMEDARQLVGGGKRCLSTTDSTQVDVEVLPAYKNRWFSQTKLAPPIHMTGEQQNIVKLQSDIGNATVTACNRRAVRRSVSFASRLR